MNGEIKLPNVTLVGLTSVNLYETVCAMKYSMKNIDFGKAVFISHKKPFNLPRSIEFKYTSKMNNIDDYSYKMVYDLGDYIDTEFALIVHRDGFVVHPECWKDNFLDYDYIGSPWPVEDCFKDIYGNICRVGNGVSLRSKKFMMFPKQSNMPWGKVSDEPCNEDVFLCCTNRHLIDAAGLKIAPIEVAKYFGHEYMIPEIEGITPFLFHQWNGTNAYYTKFRNVTIRLYRKIKRKLGNY